MSCFKTELKVPLYFAQVMKCYGDLLFCDIEMNNAFKFLK